MKFPRISRRKFIAGILLATPCAIGADAKWIEPTWLKIRRLRIGSGTPTHRLVHFTDLHHKGDAEYLKAVVKEINRLSPDFVCFTGDIITAK
jgi:predicted MPP superfamily phosphohydrolase